MAQESNTSWNSTIALCDELSAMARVGIPFESGILGGGVAGSSHYRKISAQLSADLRQGRPLSDAIDSQKDRLPGLFHAVVKAGMKSNNIADALEGVSRFAKKLQQIKRRIYLSSIYPIIVICFALLMSCFLIWAVGTKLMRGYEAFRLKSTSISETVEWILQYSHYLIGGIPIFFISLFLIFFFFSNRHLTNIAPSFLSWFPGIRKTASDYECSLFSDVFALCLEHEVPLDEAFVLAAEASGNEKFATESTAVALQLQQGQTLEQSFSSAQNHTFPKYMRWMMGVGQKHDVLANTMRQMGTVYFRRAQHRAGWIEQVIPIFLLGGVAGTAVLFYALMLFLPMSDMLKQLSLQG